MTVSIMVFGDESLVAVDIAYRLRLGCTLPARFQHERKPRAKNAGNIILFSGFIRAGVCRWFESYFRR